MKSYGYAFGGPDEVAMAQQAVDAANAKVKALAVKRKNQVSLIASTQSALNRCGDPNAIAFLTLGGSTAACILEHEMLRGQQNAFLEELDRQIAMANAELVEAKRALAAAIAMPDAPADAYIPPSGGGTSSGSAVKQPYKAGGASSALSAGGDSLLSNPLVLGGIGLAVAGIAIVMLKRPRASVAGYRRRR